MSYFQGLKPLTPIVLVLVAFFLLASSDLQAENHGAEGEVQFRANYYQRDLQTNSLKARGNAWVKKGQREIWADEIEVDFSTNKAIANGNVRIKDGALQMWASHVSYWLNGREALLEQAVIISGQLVLQGDLIHKLQNDLFEIEEGSYSNCNVDLISDKAIQHCALDWKLYGRRLSVRLDGYAHIYDGIIYVKQLPVFYTPYFVVPVKSRRQSGFLLPLFSQHQTLGTGITLPFFLDLGPWQDLTIVPTYHLKAGYHLGLNYRYLYSPRKYGNFNFYLTQRRISTLPVPSSENLTNEPLYALIGKWAIDAHNVYSFGERSHTRFNIKMVRDPYYTWDHASDLSVANDVPSLRSQVSLTLPATRDLFTAKVTHFQSLLISKDRGVDEGAPTQAPSLNYSQINTPLWQQYLSYELDTSFDHFYRPRAFDNVPEKPLGLGLNTDDNPRLDVNDYVRRGKRLSLEPRLIANFPLLSGLQFQPVLKAGSLVYHFDTPKNEVVHREYLETEFPVQLTLSRAYSTPISGYEKLGHVMQTRFMYATSPYQSAEGSHPFFFREENGLSNPRFDIRDQITPYEYMRFEFVNRLLRQNSTKRTERFFRLQLSQQLNLRTFRDDPRYQRRVGPIELLLEVNFWKLLAQTQANYQLETNRGIRENQWSSSLEYHGDEKDFIRLNSRFVESTDETLRQQSVYLTFYKRLPFFFDVGGQAEYSILRKQMLGHMIGFYFQGKPRSCWGLSLETGRDTYNNPFARFNFSLYFGNQNDIRPF